MTLEATKENGGCMRCYVALPDVDGAMWSVPLIPRIGQTSLRGAGAWEAEPSHRILAVIRHPLTRLISAWRYRREACGWSDDWASFLRKLGFYAGDKHELLDRHLRPASWYLSNLRVKQWITLSQLSHRFHLRHQNKTPKGLQWPPVFPDLESSILQGLYKKDLIFYNQVNGRAIQK